MLSGQAKLPFSPTLNLLALLPSRPHTQSERASLLSADGEPQSPPNRDEMTLGLTAVFTSIWRELLAQSMVTIISTIVAALYIELEPSHFMDLPTILLYVPLLLSFFFSSLCSPFSFSMSPFPYTFVYVSLLFHVPPSSSAFVLWLLLPSLFLFFFLLFLFLLFPLRSLLLSLFFLS